MPATRSHKKRDLLQELSLAGACSEAQNWAKDQIEAGKTIQQIWRAAPTDWIKWWVEHVDNNFLHCDMEVMDSNKCPRCIFFKDRKKIFKKFPTFPRYPEPERAGIINGS